MLEFLLKNEGAKMGRGQKYEQILENLILSSANKIGRPIVVYLPTYHVRFSSYHAEPTYLPKIGRH